MTPGRRIDEARSGAPAADRARRIADLLHDVSVELSAGERGAEQLCRGFLPAGESVYINFAPHDSYHAIVDTAARLKRAGFRPVPHVAARYLTGRTQLDDFLARAAGVGVDQMLVVAGDLDPPAGPFHSSLELIETGLFARRGMRRVGVAGYPEGHPKIGNAALVAALAAKLRMLRADGIAPYIVTQFCFEAAPIIDWLGHARALDIDAPVRIGLAGPASVATLAKFAVRCGFGNSLVALVGGQTSIARLLIEAGPDKVVRALATADLAGYDIAGLHLFTFGGLVRTGKWLCAVRDREFAAPADARVEGGTA
jgi:methylenetetrahydrofolate reductase (NADPH)